MSSRHMWRAGHMGGPNNPYQQALRTVADIVEQTEDAQMAVINSGGLGSEEDMLGMLLAGRQQAMVGTSASLRRLCPETLLCDLPFFFDSRSQFYQLCDQILQPEFTTRLMKKGVRLLAMMEGGWRDFFSVHRPLYTPTDLRGLRMRTMDNPVHQATITALGAVPVVLSTKESYEALRNGAIDGGDRAASNYMDYGYQKIAPYFCEIGIFMISSYLILSEEWFQSLAVKTRNALLSAAGSIARKEREDYSAADRQAYELMVRENITITQADRGAFRKETEVVRNQVLSQIDVSEILQKIELERCRTWK